MTEPHRYLLNMALSLALVSAGCVLVWPFLEEAFLTNTAINSLIVLALAIGIAYALARVWSLGREVRWVNAVRRSEPGLVAPPRPRLLAPMAALLGEHAGPMTLTAQATRAILDSIGTRLDESREVTRYLISLLVFLGLLGTFWGLLTTVTAAGSMIAALDLGAGSGDGSFAELVHGLKDLLKGAGTAFSSSLLGLLSGPLILGFLDLQATQAQNRFYNDLEEWLSTRTRLAASGAEALADADHETPGYVAAVLERMAESLGALTRTITRAENARTNADSHLVEMTERLGVLAGAMHASDARLGEFLRMQSEIRDQLHALGAALQAGSEGGARGLETEVRAVGQTIHRLAEEAAAMRDEALGDLKFELKLLRKALAGRAALEPGPARPFGETAAPREG